jgi:hypothetical protein
MDLSGVEGEGDPGAPQGAARPRYSTERHFLRKPTSFGAEILAPDLEQNFRGIFAAGFIAG